jgi:hypothetical protein
MTATLATALLLQLSAVLLLRHRLGKTWLRRPVTLLVLASVVYQGVSPLLLSFPSIGRWDNYRIGVQQPYVDEANLWMSAGMLALAFCYLLTRPERVTGAPEPGDVQARMPDWRLLALACLPLAVLTYEGRGLNHGGTGTSLSVNLASTFFIVLLVLAAFSFLLRHGARRLVPVLMAQSLLLAAAGERLPVIIAAIALGVLLARAGVRPQRRQVLAALALTLIAGLAITGLRAQQGRAVFVQDSGLGTRLTALGSGLTSAGTTPKGTPGLLAQAAVRLDGADFAGAILQAEHLGQPRMPAIAVPASLLLAVPSALWPSKLAHSAGLNPVPAEISDFGLQQVNFLPGLPGMYAGFLTWPWTIVLLGVLGLLSGLAERWLLRSWTPARAVLLAGAVTAALSFEQGLPSMVINLRAAAVLALAVKSIQALRARRPASRWRTIPCIPARR